MGKHADEGIRESIFHPIAFSGNLSRLSEAVAAASTFVYRDKRFIDRMDEVFADLPKFRAGFNVSGRILAMRQGKFLEISLATSEDLEEIPEDRECELTFVVREPEKCEDMMSSLNLGDLIEVRGTIVPFAYFEDDGERVVSLTLVASNVNVVDNAQR
jgi:lysyl-tRNA synthetase class II